MAGVQRRDYRIADGELTRSGAWKKQAETNLDAIELVKKLETENRLATPEEQSLLVKYTGWGASELANNMFPGYSQSGKVNPDWLRGDRSEWRPLVERLVSLLTEEEIKTAAKSTQYAHYTSESVIRSIYKALDKFGFNGGKVLEPGMGIGHFAGLLPENMKSSYTGIEMDHLTAAIAKHLYQKQNVMQADYTKVKLPDNFFDLAIGNPPFSSTVILSDPDYKKKRFKLHDYFFAKSMDKVRPGGLLVFISSRYTMDKMDDKARKYLAERADLLGAIRLPQTAFKQNAGTEVVTDVLFLRKKAPGEETTGQPWMELKEVKPDKGAPVMVNEYFADHPEMVLGRHSREGSMYGKDEYTVLPHDGNIEDHFAKSVESLPKAVYSIVRKTSDDQKAAVIERDFNPKNKKEGGLYLADDGKLMIVDKGSGAPVSALKTKLDPKDIKWLKEYVKVRDALKQAQYDQLNDLDWETSLAAANKAYDDFVKKHGRIKDFSVYERTIKDEDGNEQTTEYRRYKNENLWKIDIESQLVLALEDITEEDEVVKGPFLLGRTIRKPTRPDVKSVPDALAVSLDEIGRLDIDYVANVAGLPRKEVINRLGELIYEEPGQDGYQLSDEYLSGDVVKKLEEARAAAKVDPKYQRNVDALAKVQPAPLTPKNITVILGANWIPVEHYNDFADEVIGLAGPDIMFDTRDNSWRVEVNKESGYGYRRKKAKVGTHQLRSATAEWGTQDRGPNEILASVLNNATIKVTKTEVVGGNRRTYTDEAATAQANEKAKLMRERFRAWVWEDAERASELLGLYNTKFNNIAGRRFDGSHLTLPGVSLKWNIHDHQKRAIWRIIQSGNTYLGHAVGAGKTFEMIAAGMEMRRLGQIRKPLYVVPNHMLQQFASEFQEFYPLAHIMVADEENFHTDNRRRFVAQAALNDPDAIVMTHSSFGLLKMKAENIAPVRDKTLNDLREALESMSEDDEPRYKVKRMEQRIEQAEQRFDSLIASEGKDDVITFEEMGADFLFVDEAHNFRKLDFVTNRQAKGIDPVGSRRAVDLYIKSRWLEQQRPGRSHVFASGTPVTNTLGELFTLMRFFIEDQMDKDGINHFDSWANMFGIVQPDYEMNAAGRYEIVERFASFVNVPELMSRVRTFMDVLTWSQLKDFVKVPDVAGGKPEIVMAPPSAAMKEYQRDVLLPRIKASRNWKPSPQQKGNPDPLINIITDGRLASIDMRFVDSKAKNDPKSKLNLFADGIIETYKNTKALEYINPETKETDSVKGAAQIVFYNHGFGKMVAKNRGFDARAWVMKRLKDAKIPVSEVAWIEDYDTAPKKEAMFKEVRQGKKKILIGSAKKMGTGVNVQRRLIAQHYLDPPWYPADVEQPDGRIVRQGNQNKALDRAVTMKRYATKGSYDATMWQMVARKARMIEQAFLGDASVRKLDDISESSQYEMAAALASGDERAIQIAGMKADIERLSRLQEAHYQDQSKLRGDKGSDEYHLKWKEGRLKDIEEAKKVLPDHLYGAFEGKVEGKDFDNRSEFGEALITAYNAAVQKNQKVKGTHKIADVKGAPIVLDIEQYTVGQDTYKYEYHLGLKPTDKYFVKIESGFVINPETTDAKGLATRIVNAINGVDRDISDTEREIEDYKEKLQKINKKLGAPFEHEQELVEKVAEVARLERELAAEGATEELAEAQQQAETKVAEARQVETIKETRPDEIAAIKKQVSEDWEGYTDRVGASNADDFPIWLAKHARAEAILSQYDKAGDLGQAQKDIRSAFDSWKNDFAEEGQEIPAELTEAQNVIQGISQGQTKMFPDLMYSVRDQHRAGSLRPAKLSDVKRFFPGQEVGKDSNGNIYVKTRGGKYVTLYKVDRIDPDNAVLQAGYGTQKLAPGAVIPGAMGVTPEGAIYVKLHRTFGDVWTLAHESMHFMETAGIINDRDVDVLRSHIRTLHRDGRWDPANRKDIGGPEDRANFIADRLAVKEQRGPIGRIILRIRSFIDGILESFGVRGPESILRGIESGRIFERTGREGKARGEQYTYAGRQATGWDKAEGKFTNLMDSAERFEIDDSGANITVPQGYGAGKLPVFLEHPALYDQYPFLKNVAVSFDVVATNNGTPSGSYAILAKDIPEIGAKAGDGRIIVRAKYATEAKTTMLHEIQHAVQEHEGFARGSSPQVEFDRLQAMLGGKNVSKNKRNDQLAIEDYMHSAGEIEARDVSARASMTAEERRRTAPYSGEGIGLRDAIVRFNSGDQYFSVRTPIMESITQPGILQRSWDEFRYQAQDKFHFLNKAQIEAERKSRAQLPENQDAYLAETRYHGMAAAAIEDFDEKHVDPLLEIMSENNIEVEQADEYLHARHAREANARLREINPDREDNQALSGMSDQEAEQILDRINRGPQAQVYKRIGRMVDAITKARRDLLVEAGLETEDTIAAWEEAYQNYVPLMREGKSGAMPRKGRGFEVRGGQKLRAGSTREVVNILANVVAQHEATIVRAEKAKVSRAFLEFAKTHRGPWKIDVPEKTASFDEDGLIQYRANPLGYMLAENVLGVRVDGKDHHVTFDERDLDGMKILSALKNLDAADMGAVTRAVAKISRWLAVINTSLNPEFIISNFARDIQTAAYNMADSEADAIRMKAIKQVGSAFKGIREYQDNDRDTEWAKWFNRFRNAGGQTGWVQSYETIQDREKALINKIKDMQHGKVRSVKRGLTAAFDYIADINTAVENAIRLSVFKNLIEGGVPESKAAKIAKELTVNFNRKGNMGPVLNAFYLFYNASIQGSARLVVAGAKSRKVRMFMGATIIFATALDIMNRATGGDDDDGENRYDKIAPWIKERNLIIMLPGSGGYIQIPLPWGYNVFHVMGQVGGELLTKKNNKPLDGALRVGSAIVGAFNPIGGSSLLQLVSPTILDPFVQWAENKDWSGRKLRPSANPYSEKPSSQTFWHSAREPSKWIAKTLNEITGGDEVRPGKIDFSPEAIDLAIDTVTGGVGKFVTNLISAPIKYAKGEDVETYEIPFLRRVYGKAGKQVLTQEYYENMDSVRLVQRQLTHYKNDPAKVREIAKEYKDEVRLIARMKATQKAMKELKDQRQVVERIKDPDVRKAREKKIEETMEKIMVGFNKNYNLMKNKED